MADERTTPVLHVIVFPYFGQGHMNPILEFAKRLASKGVQITIATNLSTSKKIQFHDGAFPSIAVVSLHDDTAELGLHYFQQMAMFQSNMADNLSRLIASAKVDSQRVAFVYDANLSWGVGIAKEHGIPSAAFFTQACATVAAYYRLQVESREEDPAIVMPPVPAEFPAPTLLEEGISNIWGYGSLPSGNGKLHPLILKVLKQFVGIEGADFVLFNSFLKLEEQAVKWMSNLWPVKCIGPTIPSMYLDKRIENDVTYDFYQFKYDKDLCMNWLNTKEPNSVIYVSFGSAAVVVVEKMIEIAEALKRSKYSFFWVVRESEEQNLPENFISELSPEKGLVVVSKKEKGLVVQWCPQMDVLAHESVSCFVSHCGWNSTVEALSLGVPVLAIPQFLDQMMDAYYIEHIWGVGIRAAADEKGVVPREEIGRCLEEIMNGESSKKIKENLAKWKKLAKEAMDEGGSSDKSVDEIIEKFVSFKS